VVVRQSNSDDAPLIARMLHEFNTEFSEPSPGVDVLTRRVAAFIESGAMTYLLGGEGPDGFAQVSFRPVSGPTSRSVTSRSSTSCQAAAGRASAGRS